MNFLLSIEVLSFLDWLDKEAIFNEMYDTSIEEFILDSQHDNQLMDLIDRYKGNRKNYEKTYEGSFERELDGFLQNLKMETMLEYKRVFGESDYMRAGDWMYGMLIVRIYESIWINWLTDIMTQGLGNCFWCHMWNLKRSSSRLFGTDTRRK